MILNSYFTLNSGYPVCVMFTHRVGVHGAVAAWPIQVTSRALCLSLQRVTV